MHVLKLTPVFKERIWGGNRLKTLLDYEIPSNQTGECWGISAHPNGPSIIENGTFKGMPLHLLYEKHRDLFYPNESNVFPLLTKILDAQDDLSVQVHPKDEDLVEKSEDFGKTECWLILEADEDASIILGHQAKTKESLKRMIQKGEWNALLREVPVKKGDFIYVPAGTVHAIKKGIVLLETQQSSDTTYRLYDYDRIDDDGKKRPLHIQEAINVICIPDIPSQAKISVQVTEECHQTRYVESDYFTVEKWDVLKPHKKYLSQFHLISVLEGTGNIGDVPVKKGDHLLVLAKDELLHLDQGLSLLISYVPTNKKTV